MARKSRRNFPKNSVEEVLGLVKAISENGTNGKIKRLLLAEAVGIKPASSNYKFLLSSSFKYGLTEGTEKATDIALTKLGKNTQSLDSSIKSNAIIQSVFKSAIFKKFFTAFNNRKLPTQKMLCRILETEYSVVVEHSKECAVLMTSNGRFCDLIRDVGGSPHVMLEDAEIQDAKEFSDALDSVDETEYVETEANVSEEVASSVSGLVDKHTVFISHSKNTSIVGQVKTMLELAELDFKVAIEEETAAIPIPEKVLECMRSCTSAIICVTADENEKKDDNTYGINQNVLIEIGSAFVLYDKKVILVWDRRIDIPSNLQGLYRCEFEGNDLSWSEGMKLMKGLNDFKRSDDL